MSASTTQTSLPTTVRPTPMPLASGASTTTPAPAIPVASPNAERSVQAQTPTQTKRGAPPIVFPSASGSTPPAPAEVGPTPSGPAPVLADLPAQGQPDEVSLTALVRQCVEESSSAEPDELVAEVFDRIDPADYGTYLRSLLRPVVRGVWHEQRRQVLGKPASRSRKVDAIRDVRAILDMRVNLGGAQFKRLGDCRTSDLLAACKAMRDLAAAHARRAKTYEHLAGLLAQHGAERVEQLPREVLLRIGAS